MSNVYYSPEDFDLEPVGDIEYSSGHYEFDTRVVWHKGGQLYTARDSGCSCPVPFEDYTSIASLTNITQNYRSFLTKEFEENESGYSRSYATRSDLNSLIDKCEAKLNKRESADNEDWFGATYYQKTPAVIEIKKLVTYVWTCPKCDAENRSADTDELFCENCATNFAK